MRHIAFIMDGNRRWAKQRGLQPWQGHREGVEALKRAIAFCLDQKISYMSVYAFSLENFRRTAEEKKYLFNLLVSQAKKQIKKFLKKGIKICFVGDRNRFPESTQNTIQFIEEQTKNMSNLHLNVLFCYGGQQEIISAVKTISKKIKAGTLSENELDAKKFEEFLWAHDVPAPDLIVRTGKVKRLSNFLLYQAAYAELCFLDCFWPEIQEEHLVKATKSYLNAKRNFGI